MKFAKKACALFLSVLFILGAAGCSPKLPSLQDREAERQRFDEFVDRLPQEMMSDNDLNLNYMFEDPQKAGFEEKLLELPFASPEDFKEIEKEATQLLKQLFSFRRENLTKAQQLTYDITNDYLTRAKLTLPYYYLDNNYLGSFLGFQAQLPLLLNNFSINRQQDLDSYFHILETLEDTFMQYADLEEQRQKQGVGMCQAILDKVIGQCDNFIKSSDIFLIDSINKKIEQTEFLPAAEKKAAKLKNETLLKTNLIGAYRALRERLSNIHGRSDDRGLASLPEGREYYAALLRQTTGIDQSPGQIKLYLEQNIQSYISDLRNFLQSDSEYAGGDALGPPVYSDFSSAEETLDYLATRIFEDYPKVSGLTYTISMVPDSMKDNFSPAAYMTCKIDTPLDDGQSIYINGEYDQSLFPTLAHEGYPGHMYQCTYFKSLQMPTVRYMMDYPGYTEGWATYVENNSGKYAPAGTPAELRYANLNKRITQCYVALWDIGIHYEGWTRAQFAQEVLKAFSMSEESLQQQYDLILETPANYMKYFLCGSYFQDLYDQASQELGEDFSPVEFHKVILETGPASFDILQKQADAYIEEKQAIGGASRAA